MRTPDHVLREAAEDFLAVVAEHPRDIERGQVELVDLAAVLAGEQAPSRPPVLRRGRMVRQPQMQLRTAVKRVMEYVQPAMDSDVERALREFRDRVLRWSPPGNVSLPHHSAPPPR